MTNPRWGGLGEVAPFVAHETLDFGFGSVRRICRGNTFFRQLVIGCGDAVGILEPECGGAGVDAAAGGLVDVVFASFWFGNSCQALGRGHGDLRGVYVGKE